MASFNSTRKKFKDKYADGLLWFNELNVESQSIISKYDNAILNENFNLLQFYTQDQYKFFNKQLTWCWTKCHISALAVQDIIEHTDLKDCVEHYAVITHDKDESSPHTHVLIKFYRNERIAPKLVEYLHCDYVSSCEKQVKVKFNYLTHNSDNCRKEGKYQYDMSEVLTDDINFFNSYVDSTVDNTNGYDVVSDILDNLTERELVIKYGRDYIYHRKQYREIVSAIRYEEDLNHPFTPIYIDEDPDGNEIVAVYDEYGKIYKIRKEYKQ